MSLPILVYQSIKHQFFLSVTRRKEGVGEGGLNSWSTTPAQDTSPFCSASRDKTKLKKNLKRTTTIITTKKIQGE